MHARRYTISLFCLVLILSPLFGAPVAQERPNFLVLTIEDTSPLLKCFGCEDAVTPNIDAFAAEGVRYLNAYAPSPVCAPTRSGVITGVYSVSLGTHLMRNKALMSPSMKLYPAYLKAAGYYINNGANGKTDYQGLPYGKVWTTKATYLKRNDKSKPFFQIFNGKLTHEGQSTGAPGIYTPETLTSLPPYYPDTKKSRSFWASHLQNITNIDKWVKNHLDDLKKSGKADNTIVIFASDHGTGFPRGKRWVYESGLRIPMIVRIPEKYRRPGKDLPGSVSTELVSLIDLAPTILNLAGIEIPAHMQGRAFLGENLTPEPTHIFGSRDRMDERHDIVRSVRDSRYKYIRNYEYFKVRQQYNEYAEVNAHNGIMQEIRRVFAEPNPPPEIGWFFSFKEPEELYDLENDPFEMNDLSGDPACAAKLAELRNAHLGWRERVRDLGAVPEGIILKRRAEFGSEFDMGRKDSARIANAWGALGNLHRRSASELIAMLADSDEAVRYWAATGLGNLRDSSAEVKNALENALKDPSPWTAVAAARGLLFLGESSAALSLLKGALKHSDWTVRHAAILVIDDLGSRGGPLSSDIKNSKKDANATVVQVATRALATIDEPPLLPPKRAVSATGRRVPSPRRGAIRVTVTGGRTVVHFPGKGNLLVSTISGRKVREFTPDRNNSVVIPAHSLAFGVYLLGISDGTGVTSKKLVVTGQ